MTSDPIHVRSIIKTLSYKALHRTGTIPDILSSWTVDSNPRYLSWIYSESKTNKGVFSEIGLFMEELVVKHVTTQGAVSAAVDGLDECWARGVGTSCPNALQSPATINYFKKRMRVLMEQCPIGPNILHGYELVVGNVQGHPDILAMDQNYIIDVKVTTSYMNMREEAALQILSYAALARALGIPVHKIGLALPLHGLWLMTDIGNWDHQVFLDLLFKESVLVREDMLAVIPIPIHLRPWLDVGGHVAMDDLLDVIQRNPLGPGPPSGGGALAMQVFLTSPRSRSRVKKEVGLMDLSLWKVYVHGPYIINLCHPLLDERNNGQYYEYFRSLMGIAKEIKTRGFVVHIGTHENERRGKRRMRRSLKYLLQEATPECPLILETSAGEGNDLLTDPDELLDYYARFSKYHDRFKLCVDTCHVFAAGHDPMEFIEKVHGRFPESLVLIHFNDSKGPRGCRLDRHAGCGTGYIGYTRMKRVWSWAKTHGVDLVRE